jgi:hypothetical protein
MSNQNTSAHWQKQDKLGRLKQWPMGFALATLGSLLLLLGFLAASRVQGQSSPSNVESLKPFGFGGYRASPESIYTAARPPELTYSNSGYGFSFRFPSNFILHLREYSLGAISSHDDRGEILLVTDELPSGFWMGTNASVITLVVGVNPAITKESCAALVSPDEWTSGSVLKLMAHGVELKGRTEIERSTGRGGQFGIEDNYERQYTGYSHGVCYEFEIFLLTADQSRIRMQRLVQVDLERIFTEMESIILTAKFEMPNPQGMAAGVKTERVTKPWETSLPFPKELTELGELTDWSIQYPPGVPLPSFVSQSQFKICGRGKSGSFIPITFVYGANSSLDDAAANAAVEKLNAEVTHVIRKNGWKMRSTDCYTNGSAFVAFGKGTDRCTMNSPCRVASNLSVTIYTPVPPLDAAQ